MPTRYYAHSTNDADRSRWQPLAAHLSSVGSGARDRAAKFGVPRAGLLAGSGHDLGKYSIPFLRRLDGVPDRVDHSTAGARAVMALPAISLPQRRMRELVAYAIAGHHAGLPDRHGGMASLTERLTSTKIPDLDFVWRDEVTLDLPESLPKGFSSSPDDQRQAFQWAFLGRMIFSALVDADRRDTEAHSERTGGPPRPRAWPKLSEQVDEMIVALDRHLSGLAKPDGDPDLNALRADILSKVTSRAEDRCGLYTLTVPTGGGKTLTCRKLHNLANSVIVLDEAQVGTPTPVSKSSH